MYGAIEIYCRLAETAKVVLIVPSPEEDSLSINAASQDVLWNAGDEISGLARHSSSLASQ
jgi:hypothetical protein